MTKRALISLIILFGLMQGKLLAQHQIFNPINCDSCSNEISKVKRFQDLKFQFNKEFSESNFENTYRLLDTLNAEFNQSYLSQIFPEIVQFGLKLNDSLLWQNAIDNFVKNTLWDKNTTTSLLDKDGIQELDSTGLTVSYIEREFNQLFSSEISERSEKELIDQLFWIKAIWQRDQDYRRYWTQNILDDSSSDSTLWYFDKLNIESLHSFIASYDYPKFAMGTYCFNLVLLHMNKPEILKEEALNQLNIAMWNSVVLGDTKLSDYCYVVDRYLVKNLKQRPIFGLFYPDEVSTKTINICYQNRNKLGLRL